MSDQNRAGDADTGSQKGVSNFRDNAALHDGARDFKRNVKTAGVASHDCNPAI